MDGTDTSGTDDQDVTSVSGSKLYMYIISVNDITTLYRRYRRDIHRHRIHRINRDTR